MAYPLYSFPASLPNLILPGLRLEFWVLWTFDILANRAQDLSFILVVSHQYTTKTAGLSVGCWIYG